MRRPVVYLFALAVAAASGPGGLRAQGAPPRIDAATLADSVQRAATSAYLHGDPDGVRAARMLAERGVAVYAADAILLHQLGYALYREALLQSAATGGRQRTPEEMQLLRALLDQASNALERSASLRHLPETHALLASVYGLQAGLAGGPGAMSSGARAGEEIEHAVQLGPNNPRVWLLRGNNALFTPAMWGGGDDKALEYLNRAIQLFQNDTQRGPLPTWGRAEAYAWQGVIYQRRRDYEHARVAYNEALRVEPGYTWVRSVLLPRLEHATGAR